MPLTGTASCLRGPKVNCAKLKCRAKYRNIETIAMSTLLCED